MSRNIEGERPSFRKQRRRLLILPFAVAALKLLPACFDSEERPEAPISAHDTLLPEIPENVIPLPAKFPRVVEVLSAEKFDINYFKTLIGELQKPVKEERRLESLKQNVVVFQRSDDKGLGTAIRLCESGYYLTAAHLLIKDRSADGTFNPIASGAHLYHPINGDVLRIKNFMIDPTTDLAVVYAPSGKKRKQVDIQLGIETLEPGRKLWLVGSVLEQQGNNFQASLLIAFGKVDELSAPANFQGEKLYLLVKDMIPFGGSSGGPIIDKEGKVVAIESSYYIETSSEEPVENVRRNYTHSIISPLTNLGRIYDEKINTLPVSRPVQ